MYMVTTQISGNARGTLKNENKKEPILPPKLPVPENTGPNTSFNQHHDRPIDTAVAKKMGDQNMSNFEKYVGRPKEKVVESNSLNLDFKSTKVGEVPPQVVLDTIAAKQSLVKFDYNKDYVQHIPGAKFFVIIHNNGMKTKLVIGGEPEVINDQKEQENKVKIKNTKEGLKKFTLDEIKKLERITNKINKLKKERDSLPDYKKARYEILSDEINKLEIVEFLSSKLNKFLNHKDFTSPFNVSQKEDLDTFKFSSELSKVEPSSKDSIINNSKQVSDMEKVTTSSKKNTTELSQQNPILNQFGQAQKEIYDSSAIANLGKAFDPENLKKIYENKEPVKPTIPEIVPTNTEDDEDDNSILNQFGQAQKEIYDSSAIANLGKAFDPENLPTKENDPSVIESIKDSISKVKGPAELFRLLDKTGGIRRGTDYFTAKESQERISKFLQGKLDERDIPETDGLRAKVIEIKKNREEDEAALRGETLNTNQIDSNSTFSNLEKNKRTPEDIDFEDVVEGEPQVKEVVTETKTPVTENNAETKKNLIANLERLKNSLDQAREKYAAEQGEYNKKKYVDRFSAKLSNLFGKNSEVTLEKFNAQSEYEKAKDEYYRELAKLNTPTGEVINAMKEESDKLFNVMPLKKRQVALNFAGKLGMNIVKGAGTVFNTYQQGIEKGLKAAGMSEANAKTSAKWVGRGLLLTAMTLTAGGGAAALGIGAARAIGAEAVDWAILKRVFKNDTEEKVLTNLEKNYSDKELLQGDNIKDLEKGVVNRDKRATATLFMRTALKALTGVGAGILAHNAYDSLVGATPTAEAAPVDTPVEKTLPVEQITTPEGLGDAFVHTNEGITHPILRQLQASPELSRAFDITGTPTAADAARVAKEFGYIDASGADVRVFDGLNMEYKLGLDGSGHPIMSEIKNGVLMDQKNIAAAFEGNSTQSYEYLKNLSNQNSNVSGSNFTQATPDDIIVDKVPETTTTLDQIPTQAIPGTTQYSPEALFNQ